MNQQLAMIIGVIALIFGSLIVAVILGIMFWIRWASRGKILTFFHGNRTLGAALLKEDTKKNCLWLGKPDDEETEKYHIDKTKIFYVRWPGALPWWMNTTVRALEYVKGNPEPWDPEVKHKSDMTALSFRLITDENMLKTTWKDVRESLGIANKSNKAATYVLYGLAAVAALSVINMVMIWQTQRSLNLVIKNTTPPPIVAHNSTLTGEGK